jgi:hypothetical protein
MFEKFTGASTGRGSSRGICFWVLKPEMTLDDVESHHNIVKCNRVFKNE